MRWIQVRKFILLLFFSNEATFTFYFIGKYLIVLDKHCCLLSNTLPKILFLILLQVF